MDAATPAAPAAPDAVLPGSVLVAIPTLNEQGGIEACLRSLMTGDPRLAQVAFVVADGGSTDRTREIVSRLAAEFPNLSLIDNPGRLQSAAVNRVAETCAQPQHRILVRADAHAVYPPDYVLRLADSLMARDAASVVVPMDAVGTSCLQRAAAWVVDTPLGSGGSAHRGGRRSAWVDHGHHAAMRLEVFRAVGGYDPRFSHNEDAELDHRIAQAGGRIWLDADIRLDYTMRPSLRGLARQYWNYGRGRARTVRKHRMRPRLRQLIPAINLLLLAPSLLALPFCALGWVWPALYAALLAGASVLIAVRRRSLCGLWAGPVVAVMHNAWGAGFLHGLLTQRDAAQ